jgi:crossover junction endodeoxyribonuclease RuvC
MIILGIDPGTRRIGFGIIEKKGNETTYVAANLLVIKKTTDIEVFDEIKKQLHELIQIYHPEKVAIEKIFFATNQKTGIQVAQARGVIMSAVLDYKIPIVEYTPNEIKAGITGSGMADKKAVAKMVNIILKKPNLKVIDDVSDALAIALYAAQKW